MHNPVKNYIKKNIFEATTGLACKKVADSFLNSDQELIPVVNSQRNVVGLITDVEIFNWCYIQKTHNFAEMLIDNFMNSSPIFIEENSDIKQAADMMHYYDLPALPVVNNNKLTGIVTRKTLIEAFLK